MLASSSVSGLTGKGIWHALASESSQATQLNSREYAFGGWTSHEGLTRSVQGRRLLTCKADKRISAIVAAFPVGQNVTLPDSEAIRKLGSARQEAGIQETVADSGNWPMQDSSRGHAPGWGGVGIR